MDVVELSASQGIGAYHFTNLERVNYRYAKHLFIILKTEEILSTLLKFRMWLLTFTCKMLGISTIMTDGCVQHFKRERIQISTTLVVNLSLGRRGTFKMLYNFRYGFSATFPKTFASDLRKDIETIK